MKKGRFPDTLVLILGIVVLAQVLAYVVPPGEFQRDGRAVVPGTFHYLDESPLTGGTALGFLRSLPTFLLAIPRGLEGAAGIIFLIFVIGGVIGVVQATGAFDALIGSTLRRFADRPALLIAGGLTLFAVGASTIGLSEQYLPFVPLLVTLCIALRLDALVALGMVYGGAAVGFGAAATNPFTVVLGQEIAGLTPGSGLGLRLGLFVVCVALAVRHVVRYARRVRARPDESLVGDVDYSQGFEAPAERPLTGRDLVVLGGLGGGIAGFVVGARLWGWSLVEMSAIFLGAGLLACLAGRLPAEEAARRFKAGAAQMTTTALLVGFARAIVVVLDEGRITDTIIQALAGPLEGLGAGVAAVGMLGVQSLCNLFIPSGSGQAYVTMPIMAPLADVVGVTRQTAVLAYQMGDGFTNMVIPTNYVLMGMLGLGRIPYSRWLRFVAPLMLQIGAVCVATLLLAAWMGYA